MNASSLIAALELPQSALLHQRIPKKTLAEHAPTRATSRRRLQDDIESIHWVAALKPSNCGVPAYADEARQYVEIAVLDLQLRPKGKHSQLAPLIHRAVPYPAVLVASQENSVVISMAHKRWSHSDKGQVVIDGDLVALDLGDNEPTPAMEQFCAALPLAEQPRSHLFDLYQGWLDCVHSMQAATIIGQFRRPRGREDSARRAKALLDCERLETEMASLRAAAAREKQLARRVELNLQLNSLAGAHAAARARL